MEKIEFKDRRCQYPTRVSLLPVPGQPGMYYLEPQPGEVAEDGGVNAEMLNQMQENIEEAIGSGGGTGGRRGTGLLYITTAPSSYTTATGGFTPAYRIALSTVLTQSKASEVLVGDMLSYSYYHYPVGYVDSSYVYLGTRKSLRGTNGADGKSAYAYAQDGGYTGSETDFAEKLAQTALVGTTAEITPQEVFYAITNGRPVCILHSDPMFNTVVFSSFTFSDITNTVGSSIIFETAGVVFCVQLAGSLSGSEWELNVTNLLSVDSINALIDEKLGVIENGSY